MSDKLEAVTKIMCAAIERAEAWYCEILEQRYTGTNPPEASYKKLEQLDKEALRATEMHFRLVTEMLDALDESPKF